MAVALRYLTYRDFMTSFPLQVVSHAPIISAPMHTKRKNKNKSTTGTGTGSDSTAVAGCNTNAIDPTCLQNLYGIPTTLATQSTGNTLAVSGFIEEFANMADLSVSMFQLLVVSVRLGRLLMSAYEVVHYGVQD